MDRKNNLAGPLPCKRQCITLAQKKKKKKTKKKESNVMFLGRFGPVLEVPQGTAKHSAT